MPANSPCVSSTASPAPWPPRSRSCCVRTRPAKLAVRARLPRGEGVAGPQRHPAHPARQRKPEVEHVGRLGVRADVRAYLRSDWTIEEAGDSLAENTGVGLVAWTELARLFVERLGPDKVSYGAAGA